MTADVQTPTFTKTRQALAAYDASEDARYALYVNAKSNADIEAAKRVDEEAEAAVRAALLEDTTQYRGTEFSIGVIRAIAEVPPPPNSVSIGGVTFGQLTGGTYPGGRPRWEHTDISGDPRVALLQSVLDGDPLPEGLILLGQVSGTGSYVPITPDRVAWATSSLKPSKG